MRLLTAGAGAISDSYWLLRLYSSYWGGGGKGEGGERLGRGEGGETIVGMLNKYVNKLYEKQTIKVDHDQEMAPKVVSWLLHTRAHLCVYTQTSMDTN